MGMGPVEVMVAGLETVFLVVIMVAGLVVDMMEGLEVVFPVGVTGEDPELVVMEAGLKVVDMVESLWAWR